ncbi:chordin-like protein 1 isoform X2 [Mizuhopecten yessoensis]|uniref:Chordin-like protein 2 n=2 Tax=Mizuhopecten yessoensis TaxID=6573 RepID=A0A210PWI3_MIZYE|nr:chordin-like protein 1 isoform X2 [Mizuhopecten yessoensis]OWF40867.1 Chordin-like protein 2 [Mizuhopecten yessoensis]
MWKSLTMIIAVILGKDLCLFAESSTCLLGKASYADGDVWKFNECVNCTCNGTRVECVKELCPSPTCTEPKIVPGVCCPFCEDFANLPPTVVPDDKREDKIGGQGCEYDGNTYADGEVFNSNSTGIILNADNQCINCICTKGDVLCYLKTCNIPKKCKKWLNHSDNCCPQCADDANASLDENGSSVDPEQKAEYDCLDSEGAIHENGSEWRPQVSNCVTCSCLNGEIDCQKLTCPTDDLLPCKNPRRRGNSCCKSCRRKKKPKKECLTNLRRKNKRNKKKKGRRQGRKRNRNQVGQSGTSPGVDVTSLPSIRDNIDIHNLTIPEFFGQMCMAKKRDHIVYRYVDSRYLFVAFDDAKSQEVEVWRWRLKQRACVANQPAQKQKCKAMSANIRLSALEKFMFPSDHFRKQATQEMIFGSTTKRQVKNFKKKLTRSMAKCSKRSKCRVKVVTRAFYKHIELKHVSYNCNC